MKFIKLVFIIVIIICSYFLVDKLFLSKNILSDKYNNLIINNFYPYKKISILENEISKLKSQHNLILEDFKNIHDKYFKFKFNDELLDYSLEQKNNLVYLDEVLKPSIIDLKIKESLENLEFTLLNSKKIKSYLGLKNIYQSYYKPTKNVLMMGINLPFPGSAFLDFHKNNMFLLSSTGVIGFHNFSENKTEDMLIFKQIENNIDEFIGLKQFKKKSKPDPYPMSWFGIKDLKINNNQIYVSYTNEFKENCWNISVIVADINFKKLNFEKFFMPEECIYHSNNDKDQEFNAHQSGGRMVFNQDNLVLTVGDFRNRELAQDKDSIFGKILTINKKNFRVISMGHRNPQGLLFDKQNKFYLSTEHGPQGGDEINLIEIKDDYLFNFGWPISSYGEHYGGMERKGNKEKYIKYPLHKSHAKYGFIEPKYYFNPSIGISEIIKYNKHKYIVSSLNKQSIYFFDFDPQLRQITLVDKIFIGERIRDMVFFKNKVFLFMEETASISIIDLFE